LQTKGRKGCEATKKPDHDYGTHDIVDEKAFLHEVEQEAGEKTADNINNQCTGGERFAEASGNKARESVTGNRTKQSSQSD
jgi:hypothetical protein